MTDFLFGLASPIAYLAVFAFLILSGLGNPIPEDVTLIAGGYLAYTGVVNIYLILAIGYVGVVVGDFIPYYFGKKYGQKIIQHPRLLRYIPQPRVDKIRRGFDRWGNWMIFFARFLVGFRFPIFLLSGVMKIPFRRFLIIDSLGALLSAPIFIGLGYFLGEHVDVLKQDIHRVQNWIAVIAVALIAIYFLWRWRKSKKAESDMKAVFLMEKPHLPHLPHFKKKEGEEKGE